MIRSRLSNAKDIKGVSSTVNYINRKKDCVLFDTNIPIAHFDKSEINSEISKSFYSNINLYKTKAKNITQHDTVSYSNKDNLTPELALQYAKELYSKTHDIENRKHLFCVHNDTDNIHVHIIWANHNFDGKTYKVSNDYRIIEREIDIIEDKYNLEKALNRKATNKNSQANENKTKKEMKLEIKGIETEKDKIKKKIKSITLDCNSPSDFINLLNDNGFKIKQNGESESYSIMLGNEIFKSSELGYSYKKLKSIYGEDAEFKNNLKRISKELKNEEDCKIFGKSLNDKQEPVNKKTILYTKFKYIENSEKIAFSFKNSPAVAFEYNKSSNTISFNNTSRMSAKAGLQQWMNSNKPGPIFVSGSEDFKRNTWIEFSLMNMSNKGYELKGFNPTIKDKELLEKIKSDYELLNSKKKSAIKLNKVREGYKELLLRHQQESIINVKIEEPKAPEIKKEIPDAPKKIDIEPVDLHVDYVVERDMDKKVYVKEEEQKPVIKKTKFKI